MVGSESAFEVDEFVGEYAATKGAVERGVDHDVPDVTAAHGETASCAAGHAVPHDDHLVGGLLGCGGSVAHHGVNATEAVGSPSRRGHVG